ncbi:MAG: LURP-one-related family protein [Anaerococcus sp.]|nr:LURP-one-related family protein [Anaerococcus sp.]
MEKYYFKEKFLKITDHYPIKNQKGDEVYFVDQDFKFVGFTVSLLDRNKNPLFIINRKILSLLPTYFIDFANGDKMTIKANFKLFKKSIDAIMKDGDLNLRGNFFDYEFKIYHKNTLVGEVSKKILALRDTYVLSVHNTNYRLELIALCLCLNNIHDLEEASRNN